MPQMLQWCNHWWSLESFSRNDVDGDSAVRMSIFTALLLAVAAVPRSAAVNQAKQTGLLPSAGMKSNTVSVQRPINLDINVLQKKCCHAEWRHQRCQHYLFFVTSRHHCCRHLAVGAAIVTRCAQFPQEPFCLIPPLRTYRSYRRCCNAAGSIIRSFSTIRQSMNSQL